MQAPAAARGVGSVEINKKTKVLLIYPPATVRGLDPTSPSAVPVLGLGYIAAVLENNGFEVRLLDTLALGIDKGPYDPDYSPDLIKTRQLKKGEISRFGLSEAEIGAYIADFQPDIVGIQAMFTAFVFDALDVAAIAKKVNPNILVIMGGAHASVAAEQLLSNPNVDLVCKGEGELTMLDVADSFERGADTNGIQGTYSRDSTGTTVFNGDRPFIADMDTIPFPARHLMPMDIYIRSSKKSRYNMRSPATFIVSSRGCTRHCVFCSIHSVWGNEYRMRSPANVVDEIQHLQKAYGIREIQFIDDNISQKTKRMMDICDQIIERKIDVKWATPNGIAIWTLTTELLTRMKQSGCYRLTFGIESGSMETQKFITKEYNMGQVQELLDHANRIGIWTVSTFILGFPRETKESIQETINFSVSAGLDFAVYYLPMPFPATPLTKIYMMENLLEMNSDEDWGLLLSGTGAIGSKYFTADELRAIQQQAYKRFMISVVVGYLKNPLRVVRKIRSFEDLRYALKMGRNLAVIGLEHLRFGRVRGYRPLGMRKGGSALPSLSPLAKTAEARVLPARLTDQVYGKTFKYD